MMYFFFFLFNFKKKNKSFCCSQSGIALWKAAAVLLLQCSMKYYLGPILTISFLFFSFVPFWMVVCL